MPVADCVQGGEFDNCSLSSSVITVLISNRTKVTPDNKHRMASNISHNSNEQDVGSFSYSRDPSSAADRSVFDSVAGNPAAQPAAAGAVAENPQPAAAGAVAANPQPAAAVAANPQPAAAALHNLPAEVQNGHDIVSDLTLDSDLDFTEEETAILEAIMAAARERKRLKKRKLAEEEDAKHKEKRSDNDDQDKGNGPGGVLGGGVAVAK